jgi:PD-(D/E)XK endonuclease
MRDTTHTDQLGRVAEDLAIINLSTHFKDCIVSHVANNQLHDVEIRRKDEPLTKRICKIQVKATTHKTTTSGHNSYTVAFLSAKGAATGKKIAYNLDDVDFFLIYVFPEAKFYVVPTDAIETRTGTRLYVGCPKPTNAHARMLFEKYLEAWWLIADFLGMSTESQTQTKLADTTTID